ncbi:MAG TPA: tetratricopeptide repeat protein, partial [Candidatus Polarisedimenticolaceae bacterium]|nr:tetratricopeptide repeat protein [Candidatus Polarisedimenticolaceae bacterium]
AASVPARPLEEILSDAQTAFDAGRYSDAVVSYNQALAIDPNNEAVRKQLFVAGERYREQHQRDERWEEAIRAFQTQDFRNALRLFYRVPESEGRQGLSRYKLNGWYNLGVMALKSGACREAVDNFTEAVNLGPDDNQARVGADLARECGGRQSTTYYPAVQKLELRGLED